MFMHVIPCGPANHFFEFRSVFHPWLKDLLLHCFQGRVFDRWRRNKTEPAFRISSTSPGFGRSRLSFKSGAYCRPVPWRQSEEELWRGQAAPRETPGRRRVPREVARIEIELIPQIPAGGPLALTLTPNYDGAIGPRIRSSSMWSSRFTIGQVMVGTAVFASLLAVPRLAVSPDRIVMICLVGLLTVLALFNMLVGDGLRQTVSLVLAVDVAEAGKAPSLLPLLGVRGTIQVVRTGPLA